jgi:two-component system nitrogen regulation response regulator GlnG
VRQLENVCHWLTVMAPAQVIELKDLPPEVLAMSAVEAAPAGATALPPSVPAAPARPEPAAVAFAAAAPAPVASLVPEEPALVAAGPVVPPLDAAATAWESGLQAEALALLEEGRPDVWDVLTRRFETRLIQTALGNTRGRRIEAAQKLGIGRNTITRKIQELNLE